MTLLLVLALCPIGFLGVGYLTLVVDYHRYRKRLQRAGLSREKAWDSACIYFSGAPLLPCAVNPCGNCRCEHFQPKQPDPNGGSQEFWDREAEP